MNPLYFDDIDKGDVLSGASHTVTREEIINFAREFDPQPFHTDEGAAKECTERPFLAVCGSLYFVIQMSLISH